jgi:hypothetical protein
MTATAGKGGLLMSTSASKNINACKKYTFLKQQYQLRGAEYSSSLLSTNVYRMTRVEWFSWL